MGWIPASAGMTEWGRGSDGMGRDDLRRAIVYGSVVASFTVEAFGVERLAALTRADIDGRYAEFKEFVAY